MKQYRTILPKGSGLRSTCAARARLCIRGLKIGFQILDKDGNELIQGDEIPGNFVNAVGRLANAKLSFEFLTTNEQIKYQMIIEQLDNYNKIRQAKGGSNFCARRRN